MLCYLLLSSGQTFARVTQMWRIPSPLHSHLPIQLSLRPFYSKAAEQTNLFLPIPLHCQVPVNL